MNTSEIETKLDELLTQITEFIPDCHIEILATWTEEGKTKSVATGYGNWYARQGMAHEFITDSIALENAKQLASRINPPE